MADFKYFLFYKPFNVLSQFTKEVPSHVTLKDFYNFPSEVYPVGRLDKDSEGLLILTNDNHLKHRLLEPTFQHKRTYWVQVDNIPTEEALQQLRSGVKIRIKKLPYFTKPAQVTLLANAPTLPERDPPIRTRLHIPTAWLELTIKEGKNRQVRKMCAAVGFPVLRLVRIGIEQLTLGDLALGEVREIEGTELYRLVKIKTK